MAAVSAFSNMSNETVTVVHAPHVSLPMQALITFVYILGILGNSAALWYILHPRSKTRNPRYSLLLTMLLSNDLIAVVGMGIQMYIGIYYPSLARTRTLCMVRVLWRAFGLGSGCIVCVMAVERFFALAKPFYYSKHVTVSRLRRATVSLWLFNLAIVVLPIFGIGAYYNKEKGHCVRYKNATETIDIIYAYVYMGFGVLLCICLLLSNFSVVATLTIRRRSGASKPHVLVRRHSRNKDLEATSTAEETAFARVMIYISVSFLCSWLPQLASVPIAQLIKSESCMKYFRIADLILAIHFVIDPYIYILQKFIVFKPSAWCRKPNSRTSSVKTSNELCSL